MADTTDVSGYKVYYADNSAMANKILHSDCSDPIENPTNTFTITCNNIILTEGTTYYFTVVAQMNNASESASNPKDVPYIKPILVQDFKIVIPGENIAPTAVISANPTSGTAPLAINFDASSSTDSDGTVTSYSWDFGDGSPIDTSATPNHTFSSVGTFQVSLIVTDDKDKASEPSTVTIVANDPGATPDYAINFQPSSAEIPSGHQVDSGGSFNSDRGYGWVTGPFSAGTRDRDNPASQDQAYDTMIHVAPTSIWEIAIQNGNYSVTVCNGDASYPQGIQTVQAEGTTVIDNVTISNTNPWVEKTTNIEVSDGKLTITFTGSSNPARLCWLTIISTD